jgi:phosphonoacetate hydrolase
VSFVYLNHDGEREEAIELIKTLDGVEDVLDRQTAAARFKLMASRIGDSVVLPDIDTVFGDLPTESEQLDQAYRSHGSLHEMDIPLLLFNPKGAYPNPDDIQHNIDLTRLLFQDNQRKKNARNESTCRCGHDGRSGHGLYRKYRHAELRTNGSRGFF